MSNWYSVRSIFISKSRLNFLISRRFPYDRQSCSMKFGTWTYDSSKVNLKFYRDIQQFDLNSYVKSNEWSIIGNSASRNTEKYGKIASFFFFFFSSFVLIFNSHLSFLRFLMKIVARKYMSIWNFIFISNDVVVSTITFLYYRVFFSHVWHVFSFGYR